MSYTARQRSLRVAGGFVAIAILFSIIAAASPSDAQNSLADQRLLDRNSPYPLAPGPAAVRIMNQEIIYPMAFDVDSQDRIYIANKNGDFNIFRLSSDRKSLELLGKFTLPSEAPSNWNGDPHDLSQAPDYNSLVENTHPTEWKPILQNLTAVHISSEGILYVVEQAQSSLGLNGETENAVQTIGQNRIISSLPVSIDTPSQGFVDFKATLYDINIFGAIADLETDSGGLVYISTSASEESESALRIYRRDTEEGLVETASYFAPEKSDISFGALDFDSMGNLYVIDTENNDVLIYDISDFKDSGQPPTLLSSLMDDFSFLDTNCQEPQFINRRFPSGEMRVLSGRKSYTQLSGIAIDKNDNVYITDSGHRHCQNILTFAPLENKAPDSGYYISSVIGNRPVFQRSKSLPGKTQDPVTTNSIDYNPALNLSIDASPANSVHIETDPKRNLIYTIDYSGNSSIRGFRIIDTGLAHLRDGWNIVSWGGSDDPDGSGPLQPINTPAELANLIGESDVRNIWKFVRNGGGVEWESWPNGSLTALENGDKLYINMNNGGRYLPYILQDPVPENPVLYPRFNLLTYRGTGGQDQRIDCPAQTECKPISTGNTPEKITIPLASCLVDRAATEVNDDYVMAVFWWDSAKQRWGKVYYPYNPNFEPAGFEVVRDSTQVAMDQTGISYDDTIMVFLSTKSLNIYQAAWRDSC